MPLGIAKLCCHWLKYLKKAEISVILSYDSAPESRNKTKWPRPQSNHGVAKDCQSHHKQSMTLHYALLDLNLNARLTLNLKCALFILGKAKTKKIPFFSSLILDVQNFSSWNVDLLLSEVAIYGIIWKLESQKLRDYLQFFNTVNLNKELAEAKFALSDS